MSVPPERLSLSRELKKSRLDRAVRPSFTFERMESRTLLSGVSFLAAPVDIPIAGSKAFPVYTADINGDGVPDITTETLAEYGTTAGNHRSVVTELFGNANGSFLGPDAAYSLEGIYSRPNVMPIIFCADGSMDIAEGDINGDGTPDFVVSKDSYMQMVGIVHTPTLEVLTNTNLGGMKTGGFGGGGLNGNGPALNTLTAVQQIALRTAPAYQPGQLLLADMNGDGSADLIVAYPYNNSVVVMLNENGIFSPPTQQFAVGNKPDALAVGDLRGNGINDLVVANQLDNTVSVLIGVGDGTFLPAETLPVGLSPTGVQVADLNGDGIPDIVTTNSGSNTISVLLGNGNGTFKPATSFGTGANPVALTVGDIDGDGKVDVVTANSTGESLSILLGNGDGTFKSAENVPLGATPASVATANLTGVTPAGRLDLVVSSTTATSLSGIVGLHGAEIQVLLNTNTNQPQISLQSGIANITGTSGNDTIDISNIGSDLQVLVNGTSQDLPLASISVINVRGLGGNDSITLETGIPAVLVGGGGGSDTIVALNAANDTLRGGAGNDSISGGTGNNLIIGKAGADTLLAGTGNDTIDGNGGADELTGGSGNDSINGGAGNDTITGFVGGGTDTGIDTLVGNTGDDLVLESPGDLVLGTGGGNDTVTS